MHTKQLTVDITLLSPAGRKTTLLSGYAFLESGFLVGVFEPSATLRSEEVALLTAFTYTGCPIAARCARSDLNPWIATRGTYSSRRALSFPTLRVESSLRSEAKGDTICMYLDVIADGALPRLQSVLLPFQEKIEQRQRGKLLGRFGLDFEDVDGGVISAVAETEYSVAIDFDTLTVWRNITILRAMEHAKYMQIEQIDLFASKAEADSDLHAKRQVTIKSLTKY